MDRFGGKIADFPSKISNLFGNFFQKSTNLANLRIVQSLWSQSITFAVINQSSCLIQAPVLKRISDFLDSASYMVSCILYQICRRPEEF